MSQGKANEQISKSIVPKRKSNKLVFLCVGAGVIIILALVLLYIFFWNDKQVENKVVTKDNVDEVIAQMNEGDRTPIGSYEVVMNTTWNFPDSNSVSTNAYVENNVSNRNTVYFTITPENDAKNIVYTSPKLPVGGKLQKIKLEKPLGKGTHNMLVKYHLLKDDESELSSVTVKLKVTMKQ